MGLTFWQRGKWQHSFIHEQADFAMVIRRVGDWVVGHIIQDVPEDVGLCEFDCRRAECPPGELENCERRLNRATGELMPGGWRQQEPTA